MEIKKELLTVRLPTEINHQFSEMVAQLGISKNAFILNLIHKEIKKYQKKSSNKSDNSNQTK